MAREQKTSEQIVREALERGGFELDDAIHGQCPCGGAIRVGEIEGVPVVMHAAPLCRDFVDREPTDYMHWVNVKQGRYN